MHQGEPGDRVLILLAGHVKASSNDSHGREMVLSFRGPGDVLGELSFSHGEPRSSNVTAIEPVAAQALAASEFRGYLEQRPAAALALIDVISRRFRDANRKRVQFGDLDTVGRMAARLVELCERYGDHTDAGIQISLQVTQEDLGSWTASSRAGVPPRPAESGPRASSARAAAWRPASARLRIARRSERAQSRGARGQGERKQVTVMYTDIVGSMGLTRALDEERYGIVLDRFLALAADAVHAFEGTVNQFTGDGLLASSVRRLRTRTTPGVHARPSLHSSARLRSWPPRRRASTASSSRSVAG